MTESTNSQAPSSNGSNPRRYRIIPRKGEALFYTAFFTFFILAALGSLHPEYGVATMSLSIGSDGDGSNAGDIKGTIAHHLLVALAIFVSASFIIWNGRRLIPGSPFNHLEVGPEGFAVSGLLGRSHRPWASIARFAVRTLPHIQPPIFWVRAVPRKSGDKDLRFFMGGYTPFSVFPTRRKDVAAIADWLEAIKKSYRTGTPFPPRPVGLAAHIIERPVTTSTSAIDADTRGKHG